MWLCSTNLLLTFQSNFCNFHVSQNITFLIFFPLSIKNVNPFFACSPLKNKQGYMWLNGPRLPTPALEDIKENHCQAAHTSHRAQFYTSASGSQDTIGAGVLLPRRELFYFIFFQGSPLLFSCVCLSTSSSPLIIALSFLFLWPFPLTMK